MTNYNDGKWHGHNGGECPVNPESRVEWMRRVKFLSTDAHAGECQAKVANWNEIHAFRVIKEHKEPREFYACEFVEIDIMGNERKTFWEQCDKDEEGAVLFREVQE